MRCLLDGSYDLVIGTREGADSRRFGEPRHRHLMGRLFNYAVRLLAVPGLHDTQCGFKGFRAEVARDLFDGAQVYRETAQRVQGPRVTAFDVELLYLARKRGFRLAELPVSWRHVDGSKVRPGIDSLVMLRDVLAIRLNDLQGRYPQSCGSRSTSRPQRSATTFAHLLRPRVQPVPAGLEVTNANVTADAHEWVRL
jgi:hypothetical protein